MAGHNDDMTGQRLSELAFAAGEANLRAVIENTPDKIWLIDRNYRLLVANAAFANSILPHFARALAPGESVLTVPVFADAIAVWQPRYERTLAGEVQTFEVESWVHPGETLECHLNPIRDTAGAVTGVAGRATNITERLHTETRLHELVQRMRLASAAAGIGIWNWNFADDSLEWDEQLCRFYEVPPAMRTSTGFHAIWQQRVHPDEVAQTDAALHEARRTGQDWNGIFRIILPDGALRFIQSAAVTEGDRKGQPLRMIGINRDVTEQKNHEQMLHDTNAELERRVTARTQDLRDAVAELERADAGKDAFMAAISHELRTPLTGIIGMADVLASQLRGPLNDHQLRYIATLQTSAERLLKMVNGVLNYTGAVADQKPPFLEACRLAELCSVAIRHIRTRAEKKQQTLELQVEQLDLVIRCDREKILRILDELLDNAVKFTPLNGRIGITAEAGAGAVQLTVWDTGIGIGPGQMHFLFKPFTQIDQRLARQYEGLGLGLAFAKRLIDLLGGTIAVESTEGQGSKFVVSLPDHDIDD